MAPPPPGAVYASVGRRALAALLDLFALAACLWFFLAVAASRHGGWGPEGAYTIDPLPTLSAIAKGIAAWLLYLFCLEWWFGATLGKWAMGIAVTSSSGRRPNILQAVARNLLRVVDGFAAYLVAAVFVVLSRKRQRLGDLVAGTVVTRRGVGARLRAAAAIAALVLPVAALGTTWYSGLLRTASSRWISDAPTSVHGEGRYQAGVEGTVSFDGPSSLRSIKGGTGSIQVSETLVMDAARFAAGKDGPERPKAIFTPGERVAVLFNLAGVYPSPGSSSGRTRTKVRVLDGAGVEVVEPSQLDDDVAARPGQALARHVEFAVPASCAPGSYRVEIAIDDLMSDRRLKATLPFTVAR